MPAVSLIDTMRVKELKFKIPAGMPYLRRCSIKYANIRGDWYAGHEFELNDRGTYSPIYIVGSSFNTELGAIDNELLVMENYAKHHDHEKEITAFLRGLRFNNRQLTLF